MAETSGRIVVLGMHRSGTSAVTRTLNVLGLPVCVDLFEGKHNPAGYWESRSLIDVNDALLHEVGAEWWRPPSDERWSERLIDSHGPAALATFAAAHPTASWVWKDPRTCLTLPFWRAVLPPFVAVVVLRHPWPTAESICRRSKRTGDQAHMVDLWTTYMGWTLRALEGLPVVFVRYEEMVDDPLRAVETLVGDLMSVGMAFDQDRVGEAASTIDAGLRHGAAHRRLRRRHRRLWDSLLDLHAVRAFEAFPN